MVFRLFWAHFLEKIDQIRNFRGHIRNLRPKLYHIRIKKNQLFSDPKTPNTLSSTFWSLSSPSSTWASTSSNRCTRTAQLGFQWKRQNSSKLFDFCELVECSEFCERSSGSTDFRDIRWRFWSRWVNLGPLWLWPFPSCAFSPRSPVLYSGNYYRSDSETLFSPSSLWYNWSLSTIGTKSYKKAQMVSQLWFVNQLTLL